MTRITPDSRLALLVHGHLVGGYGKMGLGLLRYSDATIAAVVDRDHAGGDVAALTGIPRAAPIVASAQEAAALGADTLVIGVATPGGVLPAGYDDEIRAGLAAGMSLVNGLHRPLAADPVLSKLLQPGRFIWDVRREPETLSNGTGAAVSLSCRRVVTVGTDMAVGKMTVALEMERAARRRGVRAKFLASGQIGICISGDGIALDAVRVDFASGAVQDLVMRYGPNADLLLIEGQGSILHPASTAWLPLIRGSVPTHLILVHRAGQQTLWRQPECRIPPLSAVAACYEALCAAAGMFPAARVAGIALNCGALSQQDAEEAVAAVAAETGLPTTDVLRTGADPLVDAVLA